MNKLILLILISLVFSNDNNHAISNSSSKDINYESNDEIIKYRNLRKNISLGLFDSRSGNTFISYNYDLLQNNKSDFELFLGIGTALITTNISFGYKQYYSRKKSSLYSALSLHLSAVTLDPDWNEPSQIGVFPTMSLGIERKFKKNHSVQYGLFFMFMQTSYGYEYGFIPFLKFDFRL